MNSGGEAGSTGPEDVRAITGGRVEQRCAEDLPIPLKNAHGIAWVDIHLCDAAAERVLSDVFGFHPIAVRDCVVRNRVPKVHIYLHRDAHRRGVEAENEEVRNLTRAGYAQNEEVKKISA